MAGVGIEGVEREGAGPVNNEREYCMGMDIHYLNQRLRRLEVERDLLLRHLSLLYLSVLAVAVFALWRTW